MKKVGRKLIGFAAVVTIGQLLVFHHYNALFQHGVSATTSKGTKPLTAAQSAKARQAARLRTKEVSTLKAASNDTFVRVSPEKDYIAYLDANNILHVEDVKTGKDVASRSNPYKVTYVSWIENPNASSTYVLVGEQIQPGQLELKTVNVSDGSQQVIAKLPQLSPNAAIRQVAFSFLTNQVYVLVDTSSTSAIFRIGTMKNLHQVPIGSRFIKKIGVSQTTHRLYVEDRLHGSYNVIYLDNHDTAHRVQLDAALISVVGNTVYYGKINQNGLVTAVYKQGSNDVPTLVQTLTTPTAAENIRVSNAGAVEVSTQSPGGMGGNGSALGHQG